MKARILFVCCLAATNLATVATSFLLLPAHQQQPPRSSSWRTTTTTTTAPSNGVATTTTQLRALIDVPPGFFTVSFATLALVASAAKNFARVRMEELAWEQRLEEGRKKRLAEDPTLTELDLRRREASMEWSAYGKPRMEEEELKRIIRDKLRDEQQQEKQRGGTTKKRKQRVVVRERNEPQDPQQDDNGYPTTRMTEEDIDAFEAEHGIEYDPYYDEPYTEDELPLGKFKLNKLYGDRIYENGEVFYRDSQNHDLYYRQGAKPRNFSFF